MAYYSIERRLGRVEAAIARLDPDAVEQDEQAWRAAYEENCRRWDAVEALFVAAGLNHQAASHALDHLQAVDADECETGVMRGGTPCPRRPVVAAVRTMPPPRADERRDRVTARLLCDEHAARLRGRWTFINLAAVDQLDAGREPPTGRC